MSVRMRHDEANFLAMYEEVDQKEEEKNLHKKQVESIVTNHAAMCPEDNGCLVLVHAARTQVVQSYPLGPNHWQIAVK